MGDSDDVIIVGVSICIERCFLVRNPLSVYNKSTDNSNKLIHTYSDNLLEGVEEILKTEKDMWDWVPFE